MRNILFFYKLSINEKGVTLIELLIVMIILALLATLVGPKFFSKIGSSRQKTAKVQIELLVSAFDTYRLDVGQYPATEQGLLALRKSPGDEKWQGPYLPKKIPLDPWGHEYHYVCPGEHGDFDLFSFGADNKEGGEKENKDVLSWE